MSVPEPPPGVYDFDDADEGFAYVLATLADVRKLFVGRPPETVLTPAQVVAIIDQHAADEVAYYREEND